LSNLKAVCLDERGCMVATAYPGMLSDELIICTANLPPPPSSVTKDIKRG